MAFPLPPLRVSLFTWNQLINFPVISLRGNPNAPLIFMPTDGTEWSLQEHFSTIRRSFPSLEMEKPAFISNCFPKRTELKSHSNSNPLPPFGQSASGLHRVHPMKPTVTWLASLLAFFSVALPLVASAGPPIPPEGTRWRWTWLPYKSAVDRRSIGSEFEGHNSTFFSIEHRCTVYSSMIS